MATHVGVRTAPVSLRKVPIVLVVLCSGHRQVRANALLDDCNTQSDINAEVGDQLGCKENANQY